MKCYIHSLCFIAFYTIWNRIKNTVQKKNKKGNKGNHIKAKGGKINFRCFPSKGIKISIF